MPRFAQAFVFGAIVIGVLTLAVGVALGETSLGFACSALLAFGTAMYVLWDHAQDT